MADYIVSRLPYVRDVTPTVENEAYRNINYGGFNRCIVKDSSTGYVLPNCVGYCWGRAIEYTNNAFPDLSRNDANVWFSQNKAKFDAGTGGYPYIDFQNKQISQESGVIVDLGTIDRLKKLINIAGIVNPGAIICYDQGQNHGYTNVTDGTRGIYYPSPGHIQTIEMVYDSESGRLKEQTNTFISNLTQALVTLGLSIYIGGVIASYAGSLAQKATVGVYKMLIRHEWVRNLFLSNSYMQGYGYALSGRKLVYVKKFFQYFGVAITLLGMVSAGNTINDLLDSYENENYLYYQISESNISSSGNELFDTTKQDLNINLNYWNTHSGSTINVQGIILVPPYVKPYRLKEKSFPWQLGTNLGLYD